jgi:hypothetical protein
VILLPLDRSQLIRWKNTDHHPREQTVYPWAAFEDSSLLYDGVWNCQILHYVVESQFFPSLWNSWCDQWLSDIVFIQRTWFIHSFSETYFMINPFFTAGMQIGVWISVWFWNANWSLNLAPRIDHVHIYIVCVTPSNPMQALRCLQKQRSLDVLLHLIHQYSQWKFFWRWCRTRRNIWCKTCGSVKK